MSKFLTSETLFGRHSHSTQLALYLNKKGITLHQFNRMQVANHPDLIIGMCLASARDRRMSEKKVLEMLWKARQIRNSGPSGGNMAVRLIRTFYPDKTQQEGYDQVCALAKALISNANLYAAADGTVASSEIGTFSYDQTDDYTSELEMHTQLQCPCCSWVGTAQTPYRSRLTLAEVEAESVMPDNFTFKSGPYALCDHCDTICRVELQPAEELPSGTDYGDPEAWEQHEEHLDYLVTSLECDMKTHGLPSPDDFLLTYNNSDWRGRTGYQTVKFNGKDLANAMTVNSDFIIRGGIVLAKPSVGDQPGVYAVMCNLAHHDASGSITAIPAWRSDVDDSVHLDLAEREKSITLVAPVMELLCCGSSEFHEYSSSDPFTLVTEEQLVEALEWLTRQLREGIDVSFSSRALLLLLEQFTDSVRKSNYSVAEAKLLKELLDLFLEELEEAE